MKESSTPNYKVDNLFLLVPSRYVFMWMLSLAWIHVSIASLFQVRSWLITQTHSLSHSQFLLVASDVCYDHICTHVKCLILLSCYHAKRPCLILYVEQNVYIRALHGIMRRYGDWSYLTEGLFTFSPKMWVIPRTFPLRAHIGLLYSQDYNVTMGGHLLTSRLAKWWKNHGYY